jgi:hypothetical protein
MGGRLVSGEAGDGVFRIYHGDKHRMMCLKNLQSMLRMNDGG